MGRVSGLVVTRSPGDVPSTAIGNAMANDAGNNNYAYAETVFVTARLTAARKAGSTGAIMLLR